MRENASRTLERTSDPQGGDRTAEEQDGTLRPVFCYHTQVPKQTGGGCRDGQYTKKSDSLHVRRVSRRSLRGADEAVPRRRAARLRRDRDGFVDARLGPLADAPARRVVRRGEADAGARLAVARALRLHVGGEPASARGREGGDGRDDVRGGLLGRQQGVRRCGHGGDGDGLGRQPRRRGDGARLRLRLARRRGAPGGAARRGRARARRREPLRREVDLPLRGLPRRDARDAGGAARGRGARGAGLL